MIETRSDGNIVCEVDKIHLAEWVSSADSYGPRIEYCKMASVERSSSALLEQLSCVRFDGSNTWGVKTTGMLLEMQTIMFKLVCHGVTQVHLRWIEHL